MECREAAQHIPSYIDQPGGPAARALDAHLRTCDHCRGELDAYRDLQGALAALATQTILGAARLLAESGDGPEALRAAVTSPGGTTAAGLRTLEARGVRSAFIEAVQAATDRSRQLGAEA